MEPINDPWMKNGGPVFPATDGYGGHYRGASLRDYFAAKALQAMISSVNGEPLGVSYADNNERFARAAYAVAEAMLKVREE